MRIFLLISGILLLFLTAYNFFTADIGGLGDAAAVLRINFVNVVAAMSAIAISDMMKKPKA